MTNPNFPAVFEELKSLLQPYQSRLVLKADSPENYYLDAPYRGKYKKEVFFGAVRINKNYVSYYLMPVYVFPEMLENLPPELKKRMQGKSCFNFKKISPSELTSLAELTRRGFEYFQQGGLV